MVFYIMVVFVALLVFSGKTHAVSINPGGIPVGRQGHLDATKSSCRYSATDPTIFARALGAWVSDADDSSNEPLAFSVGQSQNSLTLKFNVLAHNCTSNMSPQNLSGNLVDKNTYTTRYNFVSATASSGSSTFSIGGLSGNHNDVDWTNTTGAQEYFYAKLSPNGDPVNRNFNVSGLSTLPSGTHTVTVRITIRAVNEYKPGVSQPTGAQYVCVNPSDGTRASVDGLTGSNCGTTSITVPIVIKVENEAPQATINVNCSRVQVTASSPNGSLLDVRLIVDGEDQTIGFISGMTSGSTRDIDISRWRDVGGHSFTVRVFDRSTGLRFTPTARNTGNCITPSCGVVSFSPSAPQPGEDFDLTMTVNISNYGDLGDPFSYRMLFRVEDENGNDMLAAPNPRTTSISQATPGTTSVSSTYDNLQLQSIGQYTVIYRMQYGATNALGLLFPISSSSGCGDDSLSIFNKPYVKYYGNDVTAGGTFANGETCDSTQVDQDASILTLEGASRNGTATASSVETAALALGRVDQFYSAGRRQSSSTTQPMPRGPIDLIFGNFTTPATRIQSFSADPGDSGIWRCVPDFFSEHPGVDSTASNYSFSGGSNNIFLRPSSGTVAIGSGSTINISGNVNIYVEGDVLLLSNIVLNNFSSLNNVPNFRLVVKGNIYISGGVQGIADVTRLDGIYVAQPEDSGDKGIIYTCSDITRSDFLPNSNSIHNVCNSKLTVNGAFIARQVKFLRTNGSLNQSSVNEGPGGPSAEEFNFLPEFYLRRPSGNSGQIVSPNYDYIISLPPVL